MMMRLFSSFGLSLALVGALALGACSSSKGNPVDSGTGTDTGTDTPAGIKVTISGTAAKHPLTPRLDPTADFTQMVVAVVDPTTVIANPAAPPLAGGALDTTSGNCPCAWSFDNVDISKITLGLVGIVDDGRAAGSHLWVKTGTGAGAGSYIMMVQQNPMPITNRPLFAVSKVTENKLAMFAAAFGPDNTVAPGVLETRGFMLASVVGKLSAGAAPVAGATITTTDIRTNIIYPNDDFTGIQSTTAVHGTVLVVPKSANPPSIVASWNIGAPAGDTRTWGSLTAGTSPGTAFVLLFAADE